METGTCLFEDGDMFVVCCFLRRYFPSRLFSWRRCGDCSHTISRTGGLNAPLIYSRLGLHATPIRRLLHMHKCSSPDAEQMNRLDIGSDYDTVLQVCNTVGGGKEKVLS